ncbi:polysaccharide deacetylase family protein [Massilia sp. PWRC2]|uniref:polysaccharide deacetylase family protein n=1 Tax=Massilia sp. PWRC2 TaxID=2804626 RepID=UPI003CFA8990
MSDCQTAADQQLAASDSAVARIAGKAALRLLSPGGERGLSIFIYHRVLEKKDPLFPDEVDQFDFDQDLRRIKGLFNVLPLRDAIVRRAAGTLPPRAACITFDDGYADNAAIAMPILHRYGLHATFFVATGFIDGGIMWNDAIIELVRRHQGTALDLGALGLDLYPLTSTAERRAAIAKLIGKLKYLPLEARQIQVDLIVEAAGAISPRDLMMTSAQVRQLHDGGMHIGGHTIYHPILASIELSAARAEIAGGKHALEEIIGAEVPLFAYPNGKPGTDYRAEHVQLVRELGFEGAVSTAWGAAPARADLFQLPRFSPWDRTALRFAARMARNLTTRAQLA